MKKVALIILVALMGLSSCNHKRKQNVEVEELITQELIETLSYSMGTQKRWLLLVLMKRVMLLDRQSLNRMWLSMHYNLHTEKLLSSLILRNSTSLRSIWVKR